MKRRLLCTDLDRTLIHNGSHPDSPNAKKRLEFLIRYEQLTLAYVTGRHRTSIEQAMVVYDLPIPNYVVADVGTKIYQVDANGWRLWDSWNKLLAEEWAGINRADLIESLTEIPYICVQEPEKQSEFKLSFYLPLHTDPLLMNRYIESALRPLEVRPNLIWSVDEIADIRLLDIIPMRANKLQAIRHLMQQIEFSLSTTVFAGDSGNDIDVLESDIQAILVANADSRMKSWADQSKSDSLYVAKGGFLGMNGNYAAGVIEGLIHYWPDLMRSLELIQLEAN